MPRVKKFDENEVLSKAMNLFWKQGYSATSVQDLVSHLGINRGSLYDTFGDKEQLFKKSFELYIDSNKKGLTRFLNNYQNVKEGIAELFSNAIQEAINDEDKKGCFVVNTTTELIPNDEKLLIILERNKQDFEKIFHGYLKKGQAKGQITKEQDLEATASLFYTLYNGIRVVSKVNPNKTKLLNSVNVALSLLS
ncbi:MAG: TetR/AcrR family transcriptional regulator [Cytophagales bacterium]|nr:TetR/AcrR family transcriptional regulator [Cytophagales bacterium]